MRHLSHSVIAAVCWLLNSAAMAETPAPQADGWVLDQAGVLSPDTESQLEVELTEFSFSHNHEVAVLLIRGSASEGLAAYGQRVLRSWGLGGDEGRGALLLWSQEQGLTIQTGVTAGVMLDEKVQGEILIETVGPAIVEGQAERGIVQGVQRMMAVLSSAPDSAPTANNTADPQPQALPPSAMPEPERPASAEAEEPSPLPENLAADLDRILQGLNLHPGATLQALAPEIRLQAGELPGILAQGLRELSGQPVPQALGPIRLGLLVALAICAVVGLVYLLKQSWLAVAFVFGLFAAPLLAALTGFVALSLALFALAAVSPILARLLPVALRAVLTQPGLSDNASGDPRWQARPNQVVRQPQSIARPASPATISRKTASPPQAGRPPALAVKHSANAPASAPAMLPGDWRALKKHVESVASDLLPKPRGWHIAVLVVLFLMAPPLAVITLLGLSAYFAYKLLTLDASKRERLLAHPQIRERLRLLQKNHPELYQSLARLQQSLTAARSRKKFVERRD